MCCLNFGFSEGFGPGRGRPDTNGGAGHGGKGGLLFEDGDNTTYGRTYGIDPDHDIQLIGGSTGKCAVLWKSQHFYLQFA